MLGLQANVAWQYRNLFVRPAVSYTHLANFIPGNAYGGSGNTPDQFVAILQVGWLIGTSNVGVPAVKKAVTAKY
jgi:hypothetical protein